MDESYYRLLLYPSQIRAIPTCDTSTLLMLINGYIDIGIVIVFVIVIVRIIPITPKLFAMFIILLLYCKIRIETTK